MIVSSRGAEQFPIRLPPGMREHIKKAAKAAGRSMNTEIILQLQKAYQMNFQGDAEDTPCEATTPATDPDPALTNIQTIVKESGGHWTPCCGCYDTEDGHPTQRYDYSPALQTEIGCGCVECGGLGAIWWYMSEADKAALLEEIKS